MLAVKQLPLALDSIKEEQPNNEVGEQRGREWRMKPQKRINIVQISRYLAIGQFGLFFKGEGLGLGLRARSPT